MAKNREYTFSEDDLWATQELLRDGQLVEIRVLKGYTHSDLEYSKRAKRSVYKRTFFGYFTKERWEEAIVALANIAGAEAVYFTLNSVHPDLQSRVDHRLEEARGDDGSTSNKDIIKRTLLLIDADPNRKALISSTEAERQLAIKKIKEVVDFLKSQGFKSPYIFSSGNGAHAQYAIDLPPNDGGLVKDILEFLDEKFGDEHVKIDCTTFNEARLCKLYGSMACKGDDTESRPHRLSKLLHRPKKFEITPKSTMEKMVKQYRVTRLLREKLEQEANKITPKPAANGSFDIRKFMSDHSMRVVHTKKGNKGEDINILAVCPFDSSHTDRSAIIGAYSNGAWYFMCQHDSCRGKDAAALRELLDPGYKDRRKKTGDDDEDEKKPKATTILLDLFSDLELIQTAEKQAYASVPVNGHFETKGVSERGELRQWAILRFEQQEGYVPNTTALQQSLEYLQAKALEQAPVKEVFVRIGHHDGKVYVDLGNTDWEYVEIDKNGWKLTKECPIHFRRPRGFKPLPTPVKGGKISDLRQFINVQSDQEFALVCGWLEAAYNPNGPYPVLGLAGQEGSAKSTVARYLRGLIDPNIASVRKMPKDAKDVNIQAHNNWICAYDNLSSIPLWLSDALCMLATGTASADRALYTDAEEYIIAAKRPIMYNGIGDLVTRGDLRDRLLPVTLIRIKDEDRKPEREMNADYERLVPGILGAFMSAVSVSIRDIDKTKLDKTPRLADAAKWIVAAEQAMGFDKGTFLKAMGEAQEEANEALLESSNVAEAILSCIRRDHSFVGSAKELDARLKRSMGLDKDFLHDWPGNPRALANQITRLTSGLAMKGIHIYKGKDHEGRFLCITDTPINDFDPKHRPEDGGTPKSVTQKRSGDASVTQKNGLASRDRSASQATGDGTGDAVTQTLPSFSKKTENEEEDKEGEEIEENIEEVANLASQRLCVTDEDSNWPVEPVDGKKIGDASVTQNTSGDANSDDYQALIDEMFGGDDDDSIEDALADFAEA